ncbi:MAG: Transcriptional regulator [Candidatus Collierbacteria bacterium GW2011_GWB1_44_6]|uniref:Transcriptional regulator n=1 Tax=Candidatus Collierbacteria bacterium GW2011_GWB1_44_6 TaxID=1618384 RepID=A0A0G1LXH5_9BACT|nr:MAG: Transcriptional regulator [Candidatus Collierbacteria bacterium GW2011_GWB1_44_6]
MAKLSDLIISKVRVKLLKTFLSQTKEMFYVRELTRLVKEEINAVRRELDHLQKAGFLSSEKRGNRLYYSVKTSYPLYPELTNLVIKSTGFGRYIIKNRSKLGFVKYAFVSQKLSRGLVRDKDEVDLMIVGKVIMPQIAILVKQLEKMLNTELNYSCMTEEEYSYRKTHKDPFIMKVLLQPRITLIGDEIQLLS